MTTSMNKELLEKLTAIREDLLAFQAEAGDVENLIDLAKQKVPTMRRNYEKELWPYMTGMQKTNVTWLVTFEDVAFGDIQTGDNWSAVDAVTAMVPLMLADLDEIEREIQKNAASKSKGPGAAT
jgi:hypothetical protein